MNIEQIIENMSEAEKEQLLKTDFGAELEKEASVELAKGDLADALYAYGSFLAHKEVESQEELSKEASAEMDQEEAEIATAVEEALEESEILATEDTAELHKEAQAAAAFMFKGYADAIEKLAADEGKMAKMKKFLGDKYNKAKDAAKAGATAAKGHVMKNKGKYGLGAAGVAAGLGALAYKKKMEKKAGELSYDELREQLEVDQAIDAVVYEGIDKLAAAGVKAFSDKVKAKMSAIGKTVAAKGKAAGSHVMKHKGKYGAGALALGGAAYAAKKMKDK